MPCRCAARTSGMRAARMWAASCAHWDSQASQPQVSSVDRSQAHAHAASAAARPLPAAPARHSGMAAEISAFAQPGMHMPGLNGFRPRTCAPTAAASPGFCPAPTGAHMTVPLCVHAVVWVPIHSCPCQAQLCPHAACSSSRACTSLHWLISGSSSPAGHQCGAGGRQLLPLLQLPGCVGHGHLTQCDGCRGVECSHQQRLQTRHPCSLRGCQGSQRPRAEGAGRVCPGPPAGMVHRLPGCQPLTPTLEARTDMMSAAQPPWMRFFCAWSPSPAVKLLIPAPCVMPVSEGFSPRVFVFFFHAGLAATS